jgi:L,D-peptidoglycan transpeptidase YkuD (ErfK/YbiS/YcfS/YnhG family)
MDIRVSADGTLEWRGRRLRCALGRGGVTDDKREGDGATPTGCFALRRVHYRPDRGAPPATVLPVSATDPADAWCDDPADTAYNTPVRGAHAASAETLWRDDALYDVVVVLAHNDDPVVPGAGSAIFLHIARPDWGPTEGCVAVRRADLLAILAACDETTRLCVSAADTVG